MSIKRFQEMVQTARKPSSPSGREIDFKEMTEALSELENRGTSEIELKAAQELLTSNAKIAPDAREALVNFVNRRALTGPAEARETALSTRIAALTAPDRSTKVAAAEINAVIDLLAHNGVTKDERWMAYGWLRSLELTPTAKKSLKEFIFQPQTPLPKLDETLLREHLITTMNNFHHGDTLPMNQRPWGNGWESRPQVNLDDGSTKLKRMELGADMAEQGFRYAIVVSNDDKQPTLPSTNHHDYVWFERVHKETGEKQYLANSPMSNFVSDPFRYELEEGLKPFSKGDFSSYELGKERYDHLMDLAFPGKPDPNERRSVVSVKQRSDGNFDVTLERLNPGADLRKIDPKLRMLADRAGYKIETRDERERVTLRVSAFGIPVE